MTSTEERPAVHSGPVASAHDIAQQNREYTMFSWSVQGGALPR